MELPFTKAEGTGNDFIIIDSEDLPQNTDLSKFAIAVCERKKSIGADGLLLYDNSKTCDFKMCIFNPDGQEVEMCGNGARCISLYALKKNLARNKMSIETKAGAIELEINKDIPKLKLTDPKDFRLNFSLQLEDKELICNFVNTGVPHVVCFVEDLDNFDVKNTGRAIRYHKEFKPEGTNADFVTVLDDKNLRIRTYERGVEEETLACGTGAVAAALIAAKLNRVSSPVSVHTASKQILRIYFEKDNDLCKNVYLEGKCKLVYEGKYFIKEGRDNYV